jgi:hypothetical protein
VMAAVSGPVISFGASCGPKRPELESSFANAGLFQQAFE